MTYRLLIGLCAGTTVAQAQTTLQVGPRIGANLATAAYTNGHTYQPQPVLRGEAGLLMNLQRAHWGLHVAGLYTQKGFRLDDEHQESPAVGGVYTRTKETYHLNYLTLPVSLSYSPKPDGQGWQVGAGGYVGFLVNGRVRYDNLLRYSEENEIAYAGEVKVRPGPQYRYAHTRDTYSRRLDTGLHASVGYRYGGALLQLGYSYGLANVGAKHPPSVVPIRTPVYQNRHGWVALAYLLSPRQP